MYSHSHLNKPVIPLTQFRMHIKPSTAPFWDVWEGDPWFLVSIVQLYGNLPQSAAYIYSGWSCPCI